MNTDQTSTDTPRIVRELPADFVLKHGSHTDFDKGACLMEAVAYIAGERHSDHPACASRILTAHGIRLNDRFDDEERQLLAPLIPKLVGTRTTHAVDVKRYYVLVDSAVRVTVPMGLEAVGWKDLADKLRALPEIDSPARAIEARDVTLDVKRESYKRRADADAAAYASASASAAAAAYAAASAAASAYAYAAKNAGRSAARRPIVLASIAAFERAIAVTE